MKGEECPLIKYCRAKVTYDHFKNYCEKGGKGCEHKRPLEELYLRPSVWKKIIREIEEV